MRTGFTARMLQMLFATNTSEVAAALIQIHHPNVPTDLYLCNKKQDIVSTAINPVTLAAVPGVTFHATDFEIPVPSELSGSLPQTTLTIQNVDLKAGFYIINSVGTGIKCDVFMSMILLSDPSTLQLGPLRFKAAQNAFDETKADFTLSFEDALLEMYPSLAQTPYGYPALFGLEAV